MRELIAVTKALGDEQRVRIVAALAGGELCVCQIVELLDIAPSTISKHLGLLRAARILEARKDGRWIYYRLAGKGAPDVVRKGVKLVVDALRADEVGERDARRLAEIRAQDPEVLCGRQREVAGKPATRTTKKRGRAGVR